MPADLRKLFRAKCHRRVSATAATISAMADGNTINNPPIAPQKPTTVSRSPSSRQMRLKISDVRATNGTAEKAPATRLASTSTLE